MIDMDFVKVFLSKRTIVIVAWSLCSLCTDFRKQQCVQSLQELLLIYFTVIQGKGAMCSLITFNNLLISLITLIHSI